MTRQGFAAAGRDWKAKLARTGDMLRYFLRRMGEDRITGMAAALCYATALAVVPALAFVLGAMTAFPAFAEY